MKRIRYFDILRSVSFIFIIFYHMMVQLYLSDICSYQKVSPFFENNNMHIATLGVAVFFMLSGASLMYTTSGKFDIKEFYKKRFVKILIPYYIAFGVYMLLVIFMNRSVHGIFPPGTPAWRIIFTFLGMDAWVYMHGYNTFTFGIGEWFLGCLMAMYLIFPILRYLMLKNKKIFLAVATILYLILIYNYHFDVAMHLNFFVKLYEFILGMMIGCCIKEVKPKWAFLSAPVMLFFLVFPYEIKINYALKITVFAVSFWFSIACLEPWLNKLKLKCIDVISRYSYEAFLVHHVIIQILTEKFKIHINSHASVLVLFIIQLICIVIASVILKYTSSRVSSVLLKAGTKRRN